MALKKYGSILFVWLIILFGIALIQNYLRYGHSESYDLLNVVTYLCVTVLLFFPFGLASIILMSRIVLKHSFSVWQFIMVAVGAFFLHYLVGTIIIHLLGFYDSFFEVRFAKQYFGREAFFHALTLAAFSYVISQKRTQGKMISGTIGRKSLMLQADKVYWIESDDHYLKIHAEQTQLIKRATLEKMASDLSPDFIRIHRRYIVNRNFVIGKEKQHRDEFVILASGEKLKVGRSYSPLSL